MLTEEMIEEQEEMMEDARECAYQFGVEIYKRTGNSWTNSALELMKMCRRLHQIDENSCNYGENEEENKEEIEIMRKANRLAKEMGFACAYHQGDPRGWSLYLIEKGKTKNVNFNYTDGVAVPI